MGDVKKIVNHRNIGVQRQMSYNKPFGQLVEQNNTDTHQDKPPHGC
jgi:hypothetical protein